MVTGFVEGKPIDLNVVQVNGEHYLSIPAAMAWLAMTQQARAAGIVLKINTAFRSNEYQQKLYDRYKRALLAWENAGSKGDKPPPAARPGWSKHQCGVAVDIDVRAPICRKWVEENAPKFGFVNTVTCEPWHYEYKGTP